MWITSQFLVMHVDYRGNFCNLTRIRGKISGIQENHGWLWCYF